MSSLFALLFVLGFMGGPATQQPQQMARHSSTIQHTVFMPTHPAEAKASCIHVVQRGEWLSRITPNWRAVASANGIKNPNWIYIGERINLCGGAASSGPTTQASAQVSFNTSAFRGEPCQSSDMWVANISSWTVPPSCYAAIYYAGYGDCFGWVNHLAPNINSLSAHNYPVAGAVAHLAGGVQGASSAGHWVKVIAVNGPWMLVSEENMYWRGGGYNKVSFRYLYQSGGITYYY